MEARLVVDALLLLNRMFIREKKASFKNETPLFSRGVLTYSEVFMDLLKNCAHVYSRYVDYDYTFVLDCGVSFVTSFRARYFHHLAGLHHLSDIKQVTKQEGNRPASIYKKILTGKIPLSLIERSRFYPQIHKRLLYFCKFDEIITSKLIIDFDHSKVPSTSLMSKYLLYKQYEDGYAILCLKYDDYNDTFVPETFIFEETDYYIKDQVSYDVVNITRTHYKNTTKAETHLC